MLLTRQSRQPPRPELNMASMIDVVFLLLIFFMCTSSFQKLENDLPAQMPQAGQAQTQETPLEPVRIRASRVNNATIFQCGDNACATPAALVQRLKALRALGDAQVIIEGQGDVPFGDMVAALDACYQADLRRVAFSAKGAAP